MIIESKVSAPQQSASFPRYDAVVVGAGPYGLSAAAHLLGRGLKVAVFGKILELWRDHMPRGMLLRSHWWATNLSDPRRRCGFARFFGSSDFEKCYPLPRETFVEYALWFQKRAVPNVDETYVSSIERHSDRFLVRLDDGRSVESTTVVMAVGLKYYAHRPEWYTHLPPHRISHSVEHNDFSRFRGQQIVIIGGGQSAVESAALLHEAGAGVHIVSRRPIVWLGRDRMNERTLYERIRAPNASIAPGWTNWVLDHMPYLFYRFPQDRKDRYIQGYYTAAAAEWLRARVISRITLHEGHTMVGTEAMDGRVRVTISDGESVRADHVLLATGYKVDIHKLTMVHPSLLAGIKTDSGSPILNHWFESTVPGLYFIGLTSLRAFGPLYRFVAGCGGAARRVAGSIARDRRLHHARVR